MQGSISFDGTLAGSIAGGGGGGTTPVISADATVDSLSGDPSCTVSRTGTDETPTFHFAFSGIVGAEGPEGPEGPQGPAGADGTDGTDGADGVTPEVTASATVDSSTGTPSVTVTKSGTTAAPNFAFAFSNLKGETGATGATGAQGPQGPQGETGATGATGPQGPQGPQGETGATGQQGPAGVGVPTGGSTGDVLRKNSATDYDTYWDTLTALDIPYDNTSSGMTATDVQAAVTELKSNLIDLPNNLTFGTPVQIPWTNNKYTCPSAGVVTGYVRKTENTTVGYVSIRSSVSNIYRVFSTLSGISGMYLNINFNVVKNEELTIAGSEILNRALYFIPYEIS